MGEKRIEGARLTRPVRAMVRQENFAMVRSVAVFASATQGTRRKTRPTRKAPEPAATSRKGSAKTAEEQASARMRNLRKANKRLKELRAQKKA